MKSFNGASRFKLLEDGTVSVRAGVQTNCGGIAAIRVKITPLISKEILFEVSERGGGEHQDGYGVDVPASSIPAVFRDAVFEGAKQAFEEGGFEVGINFELMSATVHLVDASERRFRQAGHRAVRGWLESQAQDVIE